MASLVIQSDGFRHRVFELRPGANRFGRSPANDFQIEHATISGHHCELLLQTDALLVRDSGSTNGTFVNGQPVREARLSPGQLLRLGEVELLVESTDIKVAIPQFDAPRPPEPVKLDDGSLGCPRHDGALLTHQCTHCHTLLCDACVHRLRRRGGKLHKLCPLCSFPCQQLAEPTRERKSFLGWLQKTVKLSLFRNPKSDQ